MRRPPAKPLDGWWQLSPSAPALEKNGVTRTAASRSLRRLAVGTLSRSLWFSAAVVLAVLAASHPSRRAMGATLLQQQGPRVLTYSADVDSVVTWPLPQLLKAVPRLNKLEPTESQNDLPAILQKVGASVKASLEDFPNTASVERISMARQALDKSTLDTLAQKFEYLALAHPLKSGIGLDEYRTNDKGEPVEPGGLAGTYLVTKGFASMSLHFHPAYQAHSTFRYLGQEGMNKRQTYVVAFAEEPGIARLVSRIGFVGEVPILALMQGIVWIDSHTYQILRMQTDLLRPKEDIGPSRQTTEIDFQAVHFRESSKVVWLPREVVVTTDWKGYTYLNRHHYSNFRLFVVGTEQKVRPPEGTPPKPQ